MPHNLSTDERLVRLEYVLGTLICWLAPQLNSNNVAQLIKLLETGNEVAKPDALD